LQLVQKCDGLPLAIKNIGGVLCTKSATIGVWKAVASSNIWSMKGLPEDVHQAFYLSYEDLPSPLKQCFIMCSLYPEDYTFEHTDLIYLWFAEGFLQDNGNLWELGNEYYRELLLRNLLEDSGDRYDQSRCKMHDLLWSFTRYLGKDENFILREGDVLDRQGNSSRLRRLSVEENEVNFDIVKKEKCLRTLLIDDIPENVLADLCTSLSKLRILDLSNSNISTLPDSIAVLMHLRYLDVSNSKIKIVPESIRNLRNLVFLDFFGCTELSHVPHGITNLKQLRGICFEQTKVETIPVGLKNLENLIQLYGFKPDKNNLKGCSSLDELEGLSQLVALSLYDLDRVFNLSIVKKAKLWSKEKLQELHLEYTSLNWEDQLSQTNEKKVTAEGVLNELSPPRSLELLTIGGYFGNCLPNWLNLGTVLPTLRLLEIINCNCFENLGPLGQLPNLDFLRIEDAYSVVSVGEELFGTDIRDGSAIPPFPKLSKLELKEMCNWKEWHWNKGKSAMPKLKHLYIEACPQLRSLPEGLSHHATSLEYLEIDGSDNLVIIENFPSVKDFRVYNIPNLKKISNLCSISRIVIQDCPNMKIMENLNKSLQRMELYDSDMEVLPDYLMTTMPQQLRIDCSDELLMEITDQREGGSEWQKFKHIPKVKIYSWDESICATYHKSPFSFTTTTENESD
jgi:Leucine rich repeat